MLFDRQGADDPNANQARVDRLENYHRRRQGPGLVLIAVGLGAFVVGAMLLHIDEVAVATGEVIASSRVQIIQAVDGGVLAQLTVREGDRVVPGQELARLDQIRVGATVGEVKARLFAQHARAARLRAEVTGGEPNFPLNVPAQYREQVNVERALFRQRRLGLQEELRTLQVALALANKKLDLVEQLLASGDVSGSEVLNAQNAVNETEARLANRKNKFLEEARIDLARIEDESSQTEQILMRREQEQRDSVFTAQVSGIVKNIRVTTVGGVLRPGEEIMQIVPIDDQLIVEAKISPADIARVAPGLMANIRFDPFDYTIYGSVTGKVVYVSADTLKEESARGKEVYYRVHVRPDQYPVTSTNGKALEILPGMTARVDVRTGERTLMDFLLKPLRKTLAEALQER